MPFAEGDEVGEVGWGSLAHHREVPHVIQREPPVAIQERPSEAGSQALVAVSLKDSGGSLGGYRVTPRLATDRGAVHDNAPEAVTAALF
jgi:hypothetical protein